MPVQISFVLQREGPFKPRSKEIYKETENMYYIAKDIQEPGSSHLSPPDPMWSHEPPCHNAQANIW